MLNGTTPENAPRVSVVIVTRNGAATLPALVEAIAAQSFTGGVEIVAVDSASSDGTPDILRARGCRVVTIEASAFDHGLSRNRGIETARGEFIVLVVQDALPASVDWLSSLVQPLQADPQVAGSYARQQPRADAGPVTRYYASRWAASESVRVGHVESAEAFERLTPRERLAVCEFDDVCSCIRRSVWERYPFEATPFAEDLAWARTVMLNGYKIAYVPTAVVVHSHERSARYEFFRTRTLHRRLYHLFGLRTIPDALMLVRAVAASLALHLRLERSVRSFALAFAWPAGQFLGGRDGARDVAR